MLAGGVISLVGKSTFRGYRGGAEMGRKRDLGVLLLLVALVGIVGRWLSEPVHLDSLDLTVGGPGYHFVLQATWSGADYRADGRYISDGVVTGHLTRANCATSRRN